MMDPGWLADRTQRGPEDQGTRDGGNDPVGVVKRCGCIAVIKRIECTEHQASCEDTPCLACKDQFIISDVL